MSDVRSKLWLFLLIAISSFMARDLLFNSLLFILIVLISFFIGQRKILIKFITAYVLFAILYFVAFYLPSAVGGILLMITLTARMFIPLLLFAKVFVTSTKASELITALYALKLPRAFVITLAVAIRFFPSAGYEIDKVRTAMRLRGIAVTPRNVFTRPMVLLESFIVPLLVRASTIADELSAASITRGLDNPNPRSAFFILKASTKDMVLTAFFTLSIALLIVAREMTY